MANEDTTVVQDDEFHIPGQSGYVKRRLGRLPAKSTRKALMFSDFFKFLKLPTSQTYWKSKAPIPVRTFGNLEVGNCTRAKQAVAAIRMERIEQRKTISITDEEIKRVYREMCIRVYGSDADDGAYETDALDSWRNPEWTFRDEQGNPFTIDAYLRINSYDHDEIKAALALAGAKGIAICLNLPAAFAKIEPPAVWDTPKGQPLIGKWMPGTWGGHSLWCHSFTKDGVIIDHTWDVGNQLVTWDAMAAYCDEAHVVLDSVNSWRKSSQKAVKFNVGDVIDAVNSVSSNQIET